MTFASHGKSSKHQELDAMEMKNFLDSKDILMNPKEILMNPKEILMNPKDILPDPKDIQIHD